MFRFIVPFVFHPVVNSVSKILFDEALRELRGVLKLEDLKGTPVLIFCNKQDIDNAWTMEELNEKFTEFFREEEHASSVELEGDKTEIPSGIETEKSSVVCPRAWTLQSSVAKKGEGLREGLDWLAVAMDIS
jgi:ADP-ribosylation factor-like protein 1